jgi:hypothetical protein
MSLKSIYFEMGYTLKIGWSEIIESLRHIEIKICLIALLNILLSQLLQIRQLL